MKYCNSRLNTCFQGKTSIYIRLSHKIEGIQVKLKIKNLFSREKKKNQIRPLI